MVMITLFTICVDDSIQLHARGRGRARRLQYNSSTWGAIICPNTTTIMLAKYKNGGGGGGGRSRALIIGYIWLEIMLRRLE